MTPAIAARLARGLCLGVLATSLGRYEGASAQEAQAITARGALDESISAAAPPQGGAWRAQKWANFENEQASPEVRHVAHWAVDSHDSDGLPFAIMDKRQAKVFVFDVHGRLLGAAPALLGLAIGDDAVPGIGDRAMALIRPEERTTPAGRFVAALDRNVRGKEILWVNYEDAISMHPVVTSNAKERRAQRLTTPTVLDNRISYGCINVPASFFKKIVRPAFTGTNGIVYVLPETRPAQQLFGSYDVASRVRIPDTKQSADSAQPRIIATTRTPD